MVDFKKLSSRTFPNGYHYFRNLKAVEHEYGEVPNRFIVVDVEATGLKIRHGDRPFAISAINQDGKEFYWRFKVNPKTRQVNYVKSQLHEIDDVLSDYPSHVFHNGKFDTLALASIGIDLTTIESFWKGYRDTLLYSHVCDSSEEHGLKPLAKKYLKVSDSDEETLKEAVRKARRAGSKLGYMLGEKVEQDYFLAGKELDTYSVADVKERTLPLFQMYCEVVRDEKLTYHVAREHALAPVVYDMENRGIRVLTKTLDVELRRYGQLAEESGKKAVKVAVSSGMPKDFNQGSSKQLQELLYDRFKLPVIKTTKSGISTDADTIKQLKELVKPKSKAKDFLDSLLYSRKSEKAKDYLEEYKSLIINGAIHPSFNQTGTNTTRFSSSNPNAQNVSVKEEMPLRIVFGPRTGHYWVDADYDNLEMRLFAYACGEKALIEAFEQGESVHLVIAEELNGPRAKWKELNKDDWKKSTEYKRTKNGNFALIYGAGIARADQTYGVPGAFHRIRSRFKKLASFMESTIREAKETGYVTTMFGYRLSVPEDRAYAALNYKIQGTAGDAMKYGMLAFNEDKEFKALGGSLIMTVHDEIVAEFPNGSNPSQAADCLKRAMESPGVRLGIPLTVSPTLIRTDWTKPTDVATTFVSQF